MDVEPADHGFGLYGHAFGYPGGGLCLSVFLVLEQGGEVLVGSMDPEHASRWTKHWAPNIAYYEDERRERLFDGWRLPATYLRVGEDPGQAAGRVWTDQLALEGPPDLSPVRVVSSAQPSRRSPDHDHWDVLFLYTVDGPQLNQRPPHWHQLGYESIDDLDPDQGVMLHGEILDLIRSS